MSNEKKKYTKPTIEEIDIESEIDFNNIDKQVETLVAFASSSSS
tara:strand:+ start:33636 stop:33767 length:132 start_codon:yes stop_codon:yes gene_type:complete